MIPNSINNPSQNNPSPLIHYQKLLNQNSIQGNLAGGHIISSRISPTSISRLDNSLKKSILTQPETTPSSFNNRKLLKSPQQMGPSQSVAEFKKDIEQIESLLVKIKSKVTNIQEKAGKAKQAEDKYLKILEKIKECKEQKVLPQKDSLENIKVQGEKAEKIAKLEKKLLKELKTAKEVAKKAKTYVAATVENKESIASSAKDLNQKLEMLNKEKLFKSIEKLISQVKIVFTSASKKEEAKKVFDKAKIELANTKQELKEIKALKKEALIILKEAKLHVKNAKKIAKKAEYSATIEERIKRHEALLEHLDGMGLYTLSSSKVWKFWNAS
jgi:hypothetical protein